MEKKNYTAIIEVDKTPEEAFKSINNISGWWTEKLEGDSENLNGIFTIHFSAESFVTHKLIEVVPNKKVVWLVTDCFLPWFADKTEWTSTKMSFEILMEGDKTQIIFTHIGLVPEVECYDMCIKGWDQYIKGSLFKLITEGAGEPQK
jgi:hypothetical protein